MGLHRRSQTGEGESWQEHRGRKTSQDVLRSPALCGTAYCVGRAWQENVGRRTAFFRPNVPATRDQLVGRSTACRRSCVLQACHDVPCSKLTGSTFAIGLQPFKGKQVTQYSSQLARRHETGEWRQRRCSIYTAPSLVPSTTRTSPKAMAQNLATSGSPARSTRRSEAVDVVCILHQQCGL